MVIYLRNNDLYVEPTKCGQWVVYCISIGDKYYYGYTNHLSRRIGQHKMEFNYILKNNNSRTSTHSVFLDVLIAGCKPVFEIVTFCNGKAQASKIERDYINNTPNTLNLRRKSK